MSGYSKTPLGKKLGLKEGFNILLFQAPEHYFDLFPDWPKNCTIVKKGTAESLDFIHLFFFSLDELNAHSASFKPFLKKNGTLWVSWPKGKSKIKSDIKEQFIRTLWLDIGLVDVKVAAIDEDWSGLKFVYRLKDR